MIKERNIQGGNGETTKERLIDVKENAALASEVEAPLNPPRHEQNELYKQGKKEKKRGGGK
jgi:hypothetical protein